NEEPRMIERRAILGSLFFVLHFLVRLRGLAMSEPYRPRCKDLCCKSMIVYGEAFEQDPDFQAGLADLWCARSSKGGGLAGDDVSLEFGTSTGRGCFKEF